MKTDQNSDKPQRPALWVGDVGGGHYWYCRFTFKDDNLECYLTEHNNCKTFKELRRWWRIKVVGCGSEIITLSGHRDFNECKQLYKSRTRAKSGGKLFNFSPTNV